MSLCQPGYFGTEGVVFVELQQPGAAGAGSEGAKCDDQKHKVTLNVAPYAGALSPGPAAAMGEVGNFTNSFATKQAEITIR